MPQSKESRSRIAKALWQDPRFRAKMISANKRRWKDPNFKLLHSARLKIARNRPEVAAKIAESNKRAWANPELRESMAAIQSVVQKKAQRRKSAMRKHRANGKRLAQSLDFRLAVSRGVKLALSRPEAKAKMSASAKISNARRKAAKLEAAAARESLPRLDCSM